MPTPSGVLRELIEQHEKLREMIDRCEHYADEHDQGRALASDLTREVAKLRIAFEAHNRFEEQLLRPVLREADAFGEVRIESMVAEHLDEHRAMGFHLDGPTAELRGALYSLRAHLVAEERYFLTSRVLRDDVVSVESAG